MMLVAMLPVVTGGAALRAATVVITQLLNNEAGTPVRTFLREFTRKWKAINRLVVHYYRVDVVRGV